MSSTHHRDSRKSESRIRTGGGEIKSLPNDLHRDLSEQKDAHGYPTLWSTALQAMRHGVKVLRKQSDISDEIVNGIGEIFNEASTRRVQP